MEGNEQADPALGGSAGHALDKDERPPPDPPTPAPVISDVAGAVVDVLVGTTLAPPPPWDEWLSVKLPVSPGVTATLPPQAARAERSVTAATKGTKEVVFIGLLSEVGD